MGEEEEQKKISQSLDQSPKYGTAAAAAEVKSLVPVSDEKDSPSKPPPSDEKALMPVPVPAAEKCSSGGGSIDRDIVLTRVEQEKKSAMVKAWEDSERTKAENKALRRLSGIGSWENSKKASVEAQLRKIEEKLEKQKAEYGEKMRNKIAEIHKTAEEKRAMVEAKKGEDVLKVEEQAAKYRATGNTPTNCFACFS